MRVCLLAAVWCPRGALERSARSCYSTACNTSKALQALYNFPALLCAPLARRWVRVQQVTAHDDTVQCPLWCRDTFGPAISLSRLGYRGAWRRRWNGIGTQTALPQVASAFTMTFHSHGRCADSGRAARHASLIMIKNLNP